MTIAGLILDIVLITMLGVMIYFCMRLHKRLEVIRSGRNDLETLLHDLVQNTASAERSLLDLRENAEYLSGTLQKQITGAGRAREELEYLLSSADKVADTLMERIEKGRTSAPAAAAPREINRTPAPEAVPPAPEPRPAPTPVLQPAPKPATVADTASREAAENDLLRALEKLR